MRGFFLPLPGKITGSYVSHVVVHVTLAAITDEPKLSNSSNMVVYFSHNSAKQMVLFSKDLLPVSDSEILVSPILSFCRHFLGSHHLRPAIGSELSAWRIHHQERSVETWTTGEAKKGRSCLSLRNPQFQG